MSKEYPLLCCDSVVRAVLSRAQTQDRRPIKDPEGYGQASVYEFYCEDDDNTPDEFRYDFGAIGTNHGRGSYGMGFPCPHARSKGDVLWCRECFKADAVEPPPGNFTERVHLTYRAGGEKWFEKGEWGKGCHIDADKWTPSIHMPRWACRLTLEVTDVRVERVASISEADAKAEGCRWKPSETKCTAASSRGVFRGLWDSLYAAKGYGWDANPWVFATTFRRIEQ